MSAELFNCLVAGQGRLPEKGALQRMGYGRADVPPARSDVLCHDVCPGDRNLALTA